MVRFLSSAFGKAALVLLIVASVVGIWILHRDVPEVAFETVELRDGVFYFEGSDEPVNGWLVEHYSSGGLKSRTRVLSGKNDGISEAFYPSGQIQVLEAYSDGVADGVRTKWHENGVKASEGKVVEGAFEGLYRTWGEDGSLRNEVMFRKGKADGVSRSWYADGSVKVEIQMKDGREVDRKTWAPGEKKGEG